MLVIYWCFVENHMHVFKIIKVDLMAAISRLMQGDVSQAVLAQLSLYYSAAEKC